MTEHFERLALTPRRQAHTLVGCVMDEVQLGQLLRYSATTVVGERTLVTRMMYIGRFVVVSRIACCAGAPLGQNTPSFDSRGGTSHLGLLLR